MVKKHKKTWDKVAGAFVIIGALNWGFTLFNFNLVSAISNQTVGFVGTLSYALIGLSGLWAGIRSLMGKYLK